MDLFDGIIYINLKHRKDRRQHIEQQLFVSKTSQLLKISRDKVHRIEGIYNKQRGLLGCTQSHIKAQQYALDKGWNRVLILEDDFEWVDPNYVCERLETFRQLVTAPRPLAWNVLFFSANVLGAHPEPKLPISIRRVTDAQAGAGYAVNGRAYLLKIQRTFQECVRGLRERRAPCVYSPDFAWKKHQRVDRWYAFAPTNIGRQYPSYSDNKKVRVIYKHK